MTLHRSTRSRETQPNTCRHNWLIPNDMYWSYYAFMVSVVALLMILYDIETIGFHSYNIKGDCDQITWFIELYSNHLFSSTAICVALISSLLLWCGIAFYNVLFVLIWSTPNMQQQTTYPSENPHKQGPTHPTGQGGTIAVRGLIQCLM